MKNDLEAMGAEFAIEQVNVSVMFDMMNTGDCPIWAAAYGDGTPDPDCYQMFHSESIAAQNNPYYTNDPEVDRLIMEGRKTLDRAVRLPIYNELYRKIVETATCMPYYQRMEMYAVNPDVIDISSLTQDPDPFYNFYAYDAGVTNLRLK
jgi:ABC-type transport system substrate-binding protein